MLENISKGAPFLALDLYQIEEITLTPGLPIPNKKKVQVIVEKIEKVLSDASARDAILSEPSSCRSPKGSPISNRSAMMEFDDF